MLKNKKDKKGLALSKSKGFTLIELLVVIAIIGILASVVLASLNTARKKSRDARRIADVKQVQLALELYFDGNGGKYPGGDETGTVVGSYGTLAPTYIATLPSDPLSGRAYQYQAFTTSSGTACAIAGNCVYYHLGVSLEETGTPALSSDRDSELTALTGDTIDGVSTVVNCGSDGAATVATDLCYDVTP